MKKLHRTIPVLAVGTGGAAVGILVGRMAGSSQATVRAVEAVVNIAMMSTAGPVIATGLVAASAVLAAVAVPMTVMWSIKRKERDDREEETDE